MQAFSIPEIKSFMAELLRGRLFHGWELRVAELGLMSRIEIQGSLNGDYWSEEERRQRTSPYLLWDEIQPKICVLIQGGQTPSYMNITLALPASRLPDVAGETIESFLVNIRYESHAAETSKPVLTIITGLSVKSFSLDKTPERLCDEKVSAYFKSRQIALLPV